MIQRLPTITKIFKKECSAKVVLTKKCALADATITVRAAIRMN